jgi:hypothetical protein
MVLFNRKEITKLNYYKKIVQYVTSSNFVFLFFLNFFLKKLFTKIFSVLERGERKVTNHIKREMNKNLDLTLKIKNKIKS